MRRFIVVTMLLAARAASAQSVAEPEPAPAVPPELIDGVAVESDDAGTARDLGRVVMVPIRIGTQILLAPVRGGAWLVERYQLRDRLARILLADDSMYGFYPTLFVETGLGVNAGLHMFHHDLFGHGEHLTLAAGFGGELKQRYDARLVSGPLARDTRIGVRISHRAWDRSEFFGIGNADQSAPVSAPAPLDEAVHTRFAQNVWHVELTAATRVAGPVSFGVVGAYTHRRFDTRAQLDGFQPILNVYDEMSLVGFQRGAENFYGEAALSIDSRSVANRYISQAAPSSGWYGRAGIGFAQGVDDDPSHHVRYTADLRRYLNLYHGDRVLIVRGYLEGVTAAADAIPFTDLPRIGGAELLRGYARDRFRDRVAAVGSLEYDFPLQSWVGAYAFVDAGRVAHDAGALDLRDVHLGWGGGLEFHTHDAFLFRAQAAHSADGTFLRFALDPTYDTRGSARRK